MPKRVAYGGRSRSKLGGRNHIFNVIKEEKDWVWVDDPDFNENRPIHRSFIDDPKHNGVNWHKEEN